MPVGYLVSVVLVGWWTAVALAPPTRPRALAAAGFRFSVAVSELPFVALLLLVLPTATAAAQGDLDATGGRIVLVLAVVVVAGLVQVTRRALLARPAVERAMGQSLGATAASAVRRRRPWVHLLLAPWRVRRRGVERLAGIAYGPFGRRNLLDIYRPRRGTTAAPVLVHFHGGGYATGRKNREARSLLYRMASRGWVCVSATYRLLPDADFADHLADARRALAWVREHGHEYGADPTTLVVAGSSAGAHLTALTALLPDEPPITAAVCLYGYYGRYYGRDETERPASTPRACDAAGAPPVLVAHGDRDSLVPVQSARGFVGHLREASSNPVVYVELPGGQHAFDLFTSLRFEAVADGVEVFLDEVTADRRTSAAPRPQALR